MAVFSATDTTHEINTYDPVFQSIAGNLVGLRPAGAMTRFGYLADRLMQLALAAYALNRFAVLPHLAGFLPRRAPWLWQFLHSHFDDFLMMPAALPVVLWLQRLTGLRRHDQPPGWLEMFAHLAVWTVMAKIVGPFWLHHGAADVWDVPFFAAGGVLACLWWRRHPQPRPLAGLNSAA